MKDFKQRLLWLRMIQLQSFSNRVVMLKDGQIFTEIYQGDDDKQTFIKKLSEHKVYLVE